MIRAAEEPVIPPVRGDGGVEHLQPHVGVQARVLEDEEVERDADDGGGPAHHVLAHAEPDTDDPENDRDRLEGGHPVAGSTTTPVP